ncbi:MAG: thioredoxin domain-containing protein [Pyrinomonadaceae bacterium]
MSEHKHANRLAGETSPYLLQHAHTPVEWYPWGEEALERSKREDKPILLSIGYSACHWCHVMERESFEDEEIARQMNEQFVNIKVDREERPDLDQIYMSAVQMMTRHGGWPLTVFLTPDLVPFYGGTYFPPEDRHQMPGFPRILAAVSEAYRTRPEEVRQSASEILSELQRMTAAPESSEAINTQLLDNAHRVLARSYDTRHGGFGGAPKFPSSMSLDFLLRTWKRTGDGRALGMVTHSCRQMAWGGLYDQLGGGFHRYSTDARWLVPHFEKMLYDNALLTRLYLHAFQATGDGFFRRVVEETLQYVAREMTDESGAFYSTQDADSEGVEGKFFVWDKEEVESLLGPEDSRLFCAYHGVTEGGNFEESNILNIPRPAEEVAREQNVSVERLTEAVERGRGILFTERERRVKPGRDEKVITAWNGLMLEAYAEAAAALGREDYREAAERNAGFILKALVSDGLLLHVYKDGRAKHVGFLDDYSYVVSGLVTLYETTGRLRWLEAAVRLTDKMLEEFWDEEGGGLFYNGVSGEKLIVRNKDYFDNATPSGNSVAAEALLRLSVLTGDENYARRAVGVLRLVRDAVERYPSAFGYALGAFDFHLAKPKEVAVVTGGDAEGAARLLREVWGRYLPNKVVALAAGEDDGAAAELVPLLRERGTTGGRATAYVCENYTCLRPVNTAEELAAQLEGDAGRVAQG